MIKYYKEHSLKRKFMRLSSCFLDKRCILLLLISFEVASFILGIRLSSLQLREMLFVFILMRIVLDYSWGFIGMVNDLLERLFTLALVLSGLWKIIYLLNYYFSIRFYQNQLLLA